MSKKTPEPEKVTPTQAAERMGPAIVAISTWWANQVADPTFNNMGPAELSQGEVEGFKLAMKLTPGNRCTATGLVEARGLLHRQVRLAEVRHERVQRRGQVALPPVRVRIGALPPRGARLHRRPAAVQALQPARAGADDAHGLVRL
jgi:hypothetical protein